MEQIRIHFFLQIQRKIIIIFICLKPKIENTSLIKILEGLDQNTFNEKLKKLFDESSAMLTIEVKESSDYDTSIDFTDENYSFTRVFIEVFSK